LLRRKTQAMAEKFEISGKSESQNQSRIKGKKIDLSAKIFTLRITVKPGWLRKRFALHQISI
jgi:hypothetical protein